MTTMTLLSDPAIRTYAITSTVLAAHVLLLALWTGTVRTLRKEWVNAEDAAFNKAKHTELDHPDVARVKRAHLNAIENLIPFAIVGGLYVTAAHPSATAAAIYLWTFTAVRVLHTFFYLAQKQPFRTLTFAIGVLCTFGMAFHVMRAALAAG
jgi:microsomal prostaglandin-E synthase 1